MKRKKIIILIAVLIGIYLIKTTIIDRDNLIFNNNSNSVIQELKIKDSSSQGDKEHVIATNIKPKAKVSSNINKFLPPEDGMVEVFVTISDNSESSKTTSIEAVYFTNGRLISPLHINYK